MLGLRVLLLASVLLLAAADETYHRVRTVSLAQPGLELDPPSALVPILVSLSVCPRRGRYPLGEQDRAVLQSAGDLHVLHASLLQVRRPGTDRIDSSRIERPMRCRDPTKSENRKWGGLGEVLEGNELTRGDYELR